MYNTDQDSFVFDKLMTNLFAPDTAAINRTYKTKSLT